MNEIERIRSFYVNRAADNRYSELYSVFNRATLFTLQKRERILLDLFRLEKITPLTHLRVLDLGCGFGQELHRFRGYGGLPKNLFGVDLLMERLSVAQQLVPHANLVQGNGGNLPFGNDVFDLVLQFMLFSSILDKSLRIQIAKEILRVTKPGSLIMWYDFWLNPTNPQTRGIRPKELRELFPDCRYRLHLTTLAPPIARCVVPMSWLLGDILESLPFLRTHYLVGIRKPLPD